MTKSGAELALRLLSDDLEEVEAWLEDRVDYDINEVGMGYAPEYLGNDEAKLMETVKRVRSELGRIAKEIGK